MRGLTIALFCALTACSTTDNSLSQSSWAVEGEPVGEDATVEDTSLLVVDDDAMTTGAPSGHDSEVVLAAGDEDAATQDTSPEVDTMALPAPESIIGMKAQDAKTLIESNGGIYQIYRRFQNPQDMGSGPTEELMNDEDWQTNRYWVSLDRGNIVVDCMVR